MAFAAVAGRGTAAAKTAAASLTATASANIVTDRVVVVFACWDNSDATGDTTRLTASDESANTWARAFEYTFSAAGAAADGVTVGIYYAVTDTQIDSGDDIIVTSSDANRVAKVMVVHEFSKDAGTTIEVVSADGTGAAAGAQSVSVSGLDSGDEHLLLAVMGHEREPASLAFTDVDADYTATAGTEVSGGAANSNVSITGAYRIDDGLTGDTFTCTTNGAGESAVALAALREVSAGGTAHEMAGVAAGAGVSTGALQQDHVLAGTAAGVGVSAGALQQDHVLAGTAIGVGSATATLMAAWILAGVSGGAGSASASLDVPGQEEQTRFMASTFPLLYLLLRRR